MFYVLNKKKVLKKNNNKNLEYIILKIFLFDVRKRRRYSI